jgi:PAS domain S-box-containing protein
LRASQARFRRLAENAADIMYRYHFTPTPGFDYVSPASTSITGYTPADYYADPQLGLRMAHPADRSQLEAATQTPTMMDVPLRTRLICKDGRQIWTEQRIVPLLDTAGELIGVEGIVRDITERVEAYQMLEQRVEERTREIESRRAVAEGLREILAILNSNRPLDEILDYIIAQACHLLGTPSGAIYRLNRQEGMLSTRASHGLDAADATLSLPVSWDPVGETVMQRQPVAVTNTALAISGRCTPTTSTQHQTCLARLSEQYRALLIVPLIVKDDVYGAIALYYHEPRAFSDEEIRLACAVSDQAALAVENARLVVAAQGKAVLEERQRLARDLHDSVTQALYGITLYAEAAARILMSGDTVTVADQLRDLQEMARGALQEMRLLIFELRPPVLEAEGLVVALRTRLETVEGRSNLKTTFTMEGMSRLSAPIEQALYRIAQEALNNALKHARAHHVTVFLWQEQSRVLLEVADDGVGFDPAIAREQGGLGLRGIEERVAQLGGQLALQSAPGGGTRVRVEICV